MLGNRSVPRPTPAIAGLATSVLWIILAAPAIAVACDVCAIYSATELRDARSGFRVGIAEQYTNYGTFFENGAEAPNVADQRLRSSITQFFVSYNLTPTLAAQLTLPLISRHYRRIGDDGQPEDGDVTGLGDISLVGRWTPWTHVDEDSLLRFTLLGGLKFPTGSTSFLAEEDTAAVASDVNRLADDLASPLHGGHGGGEIPNAVGGDNLTLGTGSVDGVVGAQFFWSWNRAYLSMLGQYVLRTTGAYDYRFANDLFWFVGPGVYLLAEHEYTLSLQGVVSGETKGEDHQDGQEVSGSGQTNVYCGPAVGFSWGSNLAIEIAGDLPVANHADGVTLVPDYRIRGGLSWQF